MCSLYFCFVKIIILLVYARIVQRIFPVFFDVLLCVLIIYIAKVIKHKKSKIAVAAAARENNQNVKYFLLAYI